MLVVTGVQMSFELGAKAIGCGAGGSLLSHHEVPVADGSYGKTAACAAVAAYDLDFYWIVGK